MAKNSTVPLRFGLVGDPIAHSLSPAIHAESYRQAGVDASYELCDITAQPLQEALGNLVQQHMDGINVTMPYKSAVIPYLDELTALAELAQSVNTIKFSAGRMVGHTTDGLGMLMPLIHAGIDLAKARVCVLGAGGAGRAVTLAAAYRGVAALTLVNRQGVGLQRANELAERIAQTDISLATRTITVARLDNPKELSTAIHDSDIIINCTSIGMAPQASAVPIPPDLLESRHIVCDAVYHPRQTELLASAQACGAQTHDGVGMLISQALLAEEWWLDKQLSHEHWRYMLRQSKKFA